MKQPADAISGLKFEILDSKLEAFLPVVSVAQLVEHRSVAPRVVGSNPIAHPKTPIENRTFNSSSALFCAISVAQQLHNCDRAPPEARFGKPCGPYS